MWNCKPLSVDTFFEQLKIKVTCCHNWTSLYHSKLVELFKNTDFLVCLVVVPAISGKVNDKMQQ